MKHIPVIVLAVCFLAAMAAIGAAPAKPPPVLRWRGRTLDTNSDRHGRSPRDFFAHPSGSDAGHVPASFSSPLATVQECVNRLEVPGDRCLLKAATWSGSFSTVVVRGKHGTREAPIVIAAAGDGHVVFDGTIPVADGSAWVKDAAGRYHTNPPVPVYQMFAALRGKTFDESDFASSLDSMQMQVPARWPNARFDDKSMYFAPEHWAHAGPRGTGAHNTRTQNGHFQDRGACNSTADCCSECNANDLADSGVNLTGGIAVLNMWAGGSAIQHVLQHTPGTNVVRYNATWVNPARPSRALLDQGLQHSAALPMVHESDQVTLGDSYAGGRGRYYVESGRSAASGLQLLDAPSEWSYAADGSNVLSWMPPGNATVPSDYSVRVKNQTYAFQFYDSSHVVLSNLTFFATTVCAHDDVGQNGKTVTSLLSYLTFESLDFDFPDSSRRMFGDITAAWPTTRIWTDAMNGGPDASDANGLQVTTSSSREGTAEACARALSKLCRADVKTMNTSLCLECLGHRSYRLPDSCTVKRAEKICTTVRPECTAELASKCGARHENPERCAACVAENERELFSVAKNCTTAAVSEFCGVNPNRSMPVGPGGDKVLQYTNHRLVDLRFRYSDGIGLQAQGSGWSITNVKWEWNTWTGVAPAYPDGRNSGVFLFNGMPNPDSAFGPHVSRLSVAYNGPSKAVKLDTGSKSTSPVMDLIDFEAELQTRDDGCFVETSGTNSAHLYQSWAHDSGKSASRFDGDFQGNTRNGAFIKCVAWNVTGFVVKGDSHNVSYNTVFDGSDITVGQAQHSLPSVQMRNSSLTNISYRSITVETWDKTNSTKPTGANANTVFEGNLIDGTGPWKSHFKVDKFTRAGGYNCTGSQDGKVPPFSGVFPDCPVNGRWGANNVVGAWVVVRDGMPYDITEQLRDPWNRDFRPCPHSLAARRGAGAYKVWSATDVHHWIPGAKDRRGASKPSPRDGAVDVAIDADLIFLGAFRATGHTILLAEGGTNGSFAPLPEASLLGENNVGHPKLRARMRYAWRVNAKMPDGSDLLGPVWTFETGRRVSCPVNEG
eukprot:SAG31_NODE_2544_length_5534_cov_3.478197_3_plen_1059_part_00